MLERHELMQQDLLAISEVFPKIVVDPNFECLHVYNKKYACVGGGKLQIRHFESG